MAVNIKQLNLLKDLTAAWTGRTIRGRYQQSILGWLWAVVQPVATVAIFTIIFTKFIRVDTGNTPYVIFSYAAIVPWTFFASSLTDMTVSIVQNMNLVTKIYFPREALPISAMMARLLDFGIAFIVLFFLFLFYKVSLFPMGLLYLPFILLTQMALILGLGLFAAALNIFTRDIDPLVRLLVQLWFYASPIIYPVTLVPDRMRTLYFLNPMAGILESYRDVLISNRLPGLYFLEAAVISIICLVIGFWFFKKVEFLFADVV
jgi:lipopolysaccharide transport system permease protein